MDDIDGLSDVVQNYFETLFVLGMNNYEPMLNTRNRRVMNVDNAFLLASFTHDEFQAALFVMNLDKTPSSDGLNPFFISIFGPL